MPGTSKRFNEVEKSPVNELTPVPALSELDGGADPVTVTAWHVKQKADGFDGP
jgi:hypothetical protein